MLPVSPCPDEQELLRFALGQLAQKEAETLAEHMQSCARCVERIKTLQPDNPLLKALRSPDFQEANAPAVGAVRVRVEAVPPSGDESDLTTDLPARNHPSQEDHQESALGELIDGKYKLIEIIGEGGMGSVYLAQQTEPVRRQVALKLIKAGLDSKAVVARFEAERQALALMDHPNIAKILDGGLHQNRPFFVMELVKGVPITQYCDANKLTPHQRLELFVPVCNALQHAHQKGIIHRDIKPSNVMVALYDDKPVPKVIDFGLAKATGGSLTDLSLNTVFGGVAGTPQYMSPEQATLNNLDIDTRSDIYSLGVLLYELLTGSPPFKRKDLERAGLMEVLRVIREEEPPKPSTKLSSADALPSLSANRGSEPKWLMGLLRNELDWIVMKALEKDRRRRYETANGFAADINRYLSGEAVLAHPPSRGYRLKKFLKKNRGPVIAASLVFLVLTFGVIGTTYGMIEANRQGREANRQERIAQGRLREVEKASDLTFSIFKDLDVRREQGKKEPLEAILAKRLIKTGEQLDANTIGDPLIVAKMQNQLAETLITLGYSEQAIQLLLPAVKTRSEILGRESRDTLESMENLAEGYQYAGKFELALPLFEDTLRAMKSIFGPEDVTTLICMNNLAVAYQSAGTPNLALPLLQQTFEIRKVRLGLDNVDTLASMVNLAIGYEDANKLNLALPLLEEAVTVMKAKHPDHPDTLSYMGRLADAYQLDGKPELAIPLCQETLDAAKAKQGPNHPETMTAMNTLAAAYLKADKIDLAEQLYVQTLEKRKANLTPDHPDTLLTMNDLALAYQKAKKFDLALPLFERTLNARKVKPGPNHRDTLTSMFNLGAAYLVAGKVKEAVTLLGQTVSAMETILGPNTPETLDAMYVLTSAYWRTKQFDKSIPLLEKILHRTETNKKNRQDPETQTAAVKLAEHYKEDGQLAKAIPLLEEAYHTSRQTPAFQFDVNMLLDAYMKGVQSKEAEKIVMEELAKERPTIAKNSPELALTLARFGLVLLRQNVFSRSEELLREALLIAEKSSPRAAATFNMQSTLGGALLGQKKYADAEPLLLKGCEGLKKYDETHPLPNKAPLLEAMNRLIELYTAMEKPDEVKKWQEIKARLPKTLPK